MPLEATDWNSWVKAFGNQLANYLDNRPIGLYRLIQKHHASLSQKLGVESVFHQTIRITNQMGQLAPSAELSRLQNDLYKAIPNFFDGNNIAIGQLASPYWNKQIRDRQNILKHRKIRFQKAISLYISNNPTSSSAKQVVARCLDDLSRLWSTLKIDDVSFETYLVFDPRIFFYLGHFGCDQGSCFKSGSCNQAHKEHLSLINNSFVFIINDKLIDIYEIFKHKAWLVSARLWGIYDSEIDVFHLSNFYGTAKITRELSISIASKFFETISSEYQRHNNVLEVNTNFLYQNRSNASNINYFSLSFAKQNKGPKPKDPFVPACFPAKMSVYNCPVCGHTEFTDNIFSMNVGAKPSQSTVTCCERCFLSAKGNQNDGKYIITI